MATSFILNSFTSGEVSPGLWARTDLTKYHSGCILAKNFYIDPAGGLSNRPGTAFVGRIKQPVATPTNCVGIPIALIPFTFSTIQTYMLEFGDLYMRVVKDGGYVLNAPKGPPFSLTNANPGVVSITSHGFVNGQWIFVQGVAGMTQLNGRTFIVAGATTNTFQLNDWDNNPLDTTNYGVYVSGGQFASYFELVTPYAIADVGTLKYTQSADVLTITHPNYAPADLTRTGDTAWTLTTITFQPGIDPPSSGLGGTASTGGAYTYRYVITTISADTGEESRASAIIKVASSAQMSQVTGANIKLTWLPVASASGYNIYRQPEVTDIPDQGMLYGFAGSTTGVNFTDQNILPDFTRTPPLAQNPFAVSPILDFVVTVPGSGFTSGTTITVSDATGTGWTGFIEITAGGGLAAIITQYGGANYTAPMVTFSGGATATVTVTLGPSVGTFPSCCCYFQQRKVFAGSLNAPETIWMSQTGNFNNMDVSDPTRDSDAITATLASQQVNVIKWLAGMTSGLIVGTASGAWQVSGGQFLAPITPSNFIAQPQAFNGASDVPPLQVNYDLLYIQAKNNVARDLSYNFYVNIYTGNDMTVLSRQLFFGHTILHWVYQDEPFKLVWAVRDDGVLLTQTFLKEQEVLGWCHSDTQGLWAAIGTISEGNENAVYLAAQRSIPGINGGNAVYYMERMASRDMNTPWNNYNADVTAAWFLDCAAQYPVVTPNACLDMAPDFSVVTASTASFATSTTVGDVIRVNGGILTVTTVSSTTLAFTSTLVDPTSDMHATTGAWTLTAPISIVTGLWHLVGASVYVLSNGSVEGPYTVDSNATITLQVPSDIVTVGLLYQGEFQSLYIDTGLPTTQGKRKQIAAATVRQWDSRGLAIGSTLDPTDLTQLKERTDEQMGQPTRLQTGDIRTPIFSDWLEEGQICAVQNFPLPATITGFVVELQIGDTEGTGR
jgi:Ubiquitin-activating enzyme E1 FCCH domain